MSGKSAGSEAAEARRPSCVGPRSPPRHRRIDAARSSGFPAAQVWG